MAAGISFSDEERMALCATLQDHLYVEMGMRFQDKEVAVFSFSRERGTENGEHVDGGIYRSPTNSSWSNQL